MRAIWLVSLVFLACGGRNIGDPLFDDSADGGSLATGGRTTGGRSGTGSVPSTGGSSLGGSFGLGGQPIAGGRMGTGGTPIVGGAIGSGGRPGTGGVIGTGGVVASGGKPGTGGAIGSGGFIATGGTGAGGAPFIDKSCLQVCDKLQDLCGILQGQTGLQCAAGCSQPLVSGSPACRMATRELLDCVNKTLSASPAGCNAVSGLVLLNCSNQLIKANACGTLLL